MELTYDNQGKFRIVQMTDLHLDSFSDNENDFKTLELIRNGLNTLEADLIIITGDLFWSKQVTNPKDSLQTLYELLNDFKIPVAITYGNHDSESDYNREIVREAEKILTHHVEKKHSFVVDNKECYSIEIFSNDHKQLEHVIYIFDSGDYPKIRVSTYDWIHHQQIEWFNNLSAQYQRDLYGRRDLIFLHIPVPEYHLAKDNIINGVCEEDGDIICSPEINTGLFSAALINDKVHSFYCGHDHDNNFCGEYKGIQLCYGQITGYNAYGHLERGFRIIDLDKSKITTKCITEKQIMN